MKTTRRASNGFTLITGLSGAGRSEVARSLEDLGFFVVDNLPPALLPKMAELTMRPGSPTRVAIVVDARGGVFFSELSKALEDLRALQREARIVFLEASDEDLVRRYEATRRRHPLAPADRVVEGIRKERQILAQLRGDADLVIDTSGLTPHELRDRVRDAFAGGPPEAGLQVSIVSFGFKYGSPRDADLVIDVRFLPNPHWVPELRPHPGTDPAVRDYVRGSELYAPFLERLEALLEVTLPGLRRRGQELPDDRDRLHGRAPSLGRRRRGAGGLDRRAGAPDLRRASRRRSAGKPGNGGPAGRPIAWGPRPRSARVSGRQPGGSRPMTVKIGVNGFGRIGRNFFRAAKQRGADLDFVAVNDITDAATLAHLLKYDSVMGTYDGQVGTSANGITVDGDELRVLAERDPANLPWKELGAEIVIESTGLFTDREKAAKHLEAGAQKVVISAPAKGEDLTVVLGVNDDALRPRDPPCDLERELHDQLRGADGQGAGRRLRGRARLHDHDPRVHERPADPRPAAQGPAARARRRDQHHPDLDRRREGGRLWCCPT